MRHRRFEEFFFFFFYLLSDVMTLGAFGGTACPYGYPIFEKYPVF